MTVKEDLNLIKIKCGNIALGHGKCYICGCTVAKRGMTVHHMWYLDNNDVIYKDFPQNDSGRIEYYTKLYPLIHNNPKRFMYLCQTCHQGLERMLRYGDGKFNKMCIVRKMMKLR